MQKQPKFNSNKLLINNKKLQTHIIQDNIEISDKMNADKDCNFEKKKNN